MTETVSQYQPKTNSNSINSFRASKHYILLWLMLGAFVILFGLALRIAFNSFTRVSLDNQQGLGQFRINAIPVNAYLWQNGYSRQVNRIKLVYTNEQIPITYELMNQDESVLKLHTNHQSKTITVQVNYNPVKFADVTANPNWLSNDLLAGICMALSDKPKLEAIDECYLQADNFSQWAQENNIGKAVSLRTRRSWKLVGQAYAQTCSGTIPCGHDARTCTCSLGGAPCSPSGSSCGAGNLGTCQCGEWECVTSGSPNNLNCSFLNSNPVFCPMAGLSSCLNQCTVPRGEPPTNSCTWSGPIPPVPTYTPGPSPTPGPPPGNPPGCNSSCTSDSG